MFCDNHIIGTYQANTTYLKVTIMDNSTLFSLAHVMTKKTIKKGDSYRHVFGECLKYIKDNIDDKPAPIQLSTSYFNPSFNFIALSIIVLAITSNIDKMTAKVGAISDACILSIATMLNLFSIYIIGTH